VSPISSTKQRHHTMVVTYDATGVVTGVMLEKDWFSYDWCMSWEHHLRVIRPQGTFHLVSHSALLSPQTGNVLVDAAILGKVKTIDLREFNVNQRVDRILSGEIKRK